jgi:Cys-tRNA synthase (O-phospho-L-seryl-tRNA:Cys-tRNA synthase)
MASGPITADQLAEYKQKGYTLARRMFNSQEIDLLGCSASAKSLETQPTKHP